MNAGGKGGGQLLPLSALPSLRPKVGVPSQPLRGGDSDFSPAPPGRERIRVFGGRRTRYSYAPTREDAVRWYHATNVSPLIYARDNEDSTAAYARRGMQHTRWSSERGRRGGQKGTGPEPRSARPYGGLPRRLSSPSVKGEGGGANPEVFVASDSERGLKRSWSGLLRAEAHCCRQRRIRPAHSVAGVFSCRVECPPPSRRGT